MFESELCTECMEFLWNRTDSMDIKFVAVSDGDAESVIEAKKSLIAARECKKGDGASLEVTRKRQQQPMPMSVPPPQVLPYFSYTSPIDNALHHYYYYYYAPPQLPILSQLF